MKQELFGKNLKFLREKAGLDQIDIAGIIGKVSSSSISEYEKGKRIPDVGTVDTLARYFDVKIDDMMNKDMSVLFAVKKAGIKLKGKTEHYPILGDIACGEPILAEENIQSYIGIDHRVRSDFVLRAKGDSMIDECIGDGDYVFIKQQQTANNGDIIAILIEGEATLKRYYRDGDVVILQAANSSYKPIVLTEGDVHILGVLTAVLSVK